MGAQNSAEMDADATSQASQLLLRQRRLGMILEVDYEDGKQHVIIVAVFNSRMITLPIWPGDRGATDFSTMLLRPAAAKLRSNDNLPDPTEKTLYVAGNWQPIAGAHLNLNEPDVLYHSEFHCIDRLDGPSTALLQQRYRVCHNVGFANLPTQPSLFRRLATAEPLPPVSSDGSTFHMVYGHALCLIQSQSAEPEYVVFDYGLVAVNGQVKTQTQLFLAAAQTDIGVSLLEDIDLKHEARVITAAGHDFEHFLENYHQTSKIFGGRKIPGTRRDSQRKVWYHPRLNSFHDPGLSNLTPFGPRRSGAGLDRHRSSGTLVSPKTMNTFSSTKAVATDAATSLIAETTSRISASPQHRTSIVETRTCRHSCKSKATCGHSCCKRSLGGTSISRQGLDAIVHGIAKLKTASI